MKRVESFRVVGLCVALAAAVIGGAANAYAQSAAAVQSTIGILTDASRSTADRANAARDLAVLAQDSDAATQALIGVIGADPDPAVRAAALRALGHQAFPSAAPIQAAVQALSSDASAEVRLAAVQALNILAVDSASGTAALQNAAANDSDPGVRQAAQAVYTRLTSGG
jgi:HEAT repeat protein